MNCGLIKMKSEDWLDVIKINLKFYLESCSTFSTPLEEKEFSSLKEIQKLAYDLHIKANKLIIAHLDHLEEVAKSSTCLSATNCGVQTTTSEANQLDLSNISYDISSTTVPNPMPCALPSGFSSKRHQPYQVGKTRTMQVNTADRQPRSAGPNLNSCETGVTRVSPNVYHHRQTNRPQMMIDSQLNGVSPNVYHHPQTNSSQLMTDSQLNGVSPSVYHHPQTNSLQLNTNNQPQSDIYY